MSTDETTVVTSEEETTDEVAKMVNAALTKAVKSSTDATEAAMVKATDAVEKFMDSVAEKAVSKTSAVALTQSKASFDVDAITKGFDGMRKSAGAVSFAFKNVSELGYIAKNTDRLDLTGNVIEHDVDPIINRPAIRQVFMEQIANVVPINSDTARFTEVTGTTGAPAMTAELATIPQTQRTFQAYTRPVQKVAVISKHSNELLKYGPELVAVLRDMARIDLNLVVDAQLLSGNGTPPNLQGVIGIAPTLTSALVGPLVVPNANLFDVIRVGCTRIAIAGAMNKFMATHIVLNPLDSEELDLTKNSAGDYVTPAFYAANGMRIKGAVVIENSGITAGTFLIGDFRFLNVRPNGDIEVDVTNSDASDFANDIIAIKMRRHLAAYVKVNDNGAFLTGNIAAVKGFLATSAI